MRRIRVQTLLEGQLEEGVVELLQFLKGRDDGAVFTADGGVEKPTRRKRQSIATMSLEYHILGGRGVVPDATRRMTPVV